jgi:hypothetical protein
MWEYKQVTLGKNTPFFGKGNFLDKTLAAMLEDCGNESWELVSVVPVSNPSALLIGGITSDLIFFFKRLKNPPA